MVGLVVGMIRFIWQFSYNDPLCGSSEPDLRSPLIAKIHYLHFSIILSLITVIVSWTISLLTEPVPKECVRILIYQNYNLSMIHFYCISRSID
jgi:hypothetical protein